MKSKIKLWIARDKDGKLFLYIGKKPSKQGNIFLPIHPDDYFSLNDESFPEITFENSPQQVELISSEEYKHLKECEEICKIESDYGDKHYC